MLLRSVAILASLCVSVGAVFADFEYRYIEGEKFDRSEGAGLRNEGFTGWMGHPSGGKVVVFGSPENGFVEYDVKGLGPGEYHLFVRCLALSALTKTHVLWDGKEIGLIAHRKQGTALKWSDEAGVVTGPGDHVLRLQGSPDTTQWPYIDVILLTNQPGFTPDDKDQDFVSYTTPWPALAVKQADGTIGMEAPNVAATVGGSPAQVGVEVQAVALGPLEVGPTPFAIRLHSIVPEQREVIVTSRLWGAYARRGPQTSAEPSSAPDVRVNLGPTMTSNVAQSIFVNEAGQHWFEVQLRSADGMTFRAEYSVTVPAPVTVSLDEYAYPADAWTAKWAARASVQTEVLRNLVGRALVSSPNARPGDGQAMSFTFWPPTGDAQGTARLAIDISDLGVGRYEIVSRVRYSPYLSGPEIMTDRRTFIKYNPVPSPKWQPVQETKAIGDTILLNGKPFLPLYLGHAGIDANTAGHGFRLVAAASGDPDPLPGIKQCLDDAQKNGLYCMAALFNNHYLVHDGAMDLAHLERVVREVKDHPALFGWDLFDEPDGCGVAPEKVKAAADLIRRIDGKHILWVNLCQPNRALDYLGSTDIWSYDMYPLPGQTLAAFKAWFDTSDTKLVGKMPLGSWLQTYVGDVSHERMPTPDELRAMAYLHIIHGFKFLAYYSYYDGEPAGCLARNPELWSYTRALNAELTAMEPVILAPGPWQPVGVEPANAPVAAREKKVGGKRYVVVVSNGAEPIEVRLSPAGPAAKWKLLFEGEGTPPVAPPGANGAIRTRLVPDNACARVFEAG